MTAEENAGANEKQPGKGRASKGGAAGDPAAGEPAGAATAKAGEGLDPSGGPAQGQPDATPGGDAGAAKNDGAPSAAEGKATPATGEPPSPPAELARAEARVAALSGEVAELKDRLLRAAAELENRGRRAEREVADARQYAVTSFAREIVQVGDNLRRAIESVPPAGEAERPAALATLLEGIEATERVFLHVLGKHGVRRLEPKGEKFDANFHQAMFETETAELPSGTVTGVLQPGYAIGERVLRPALVSVAKAIKPKPPAA